MLDIEKIAKSIVAFSDYFSLRILSLLLSCVFVYHYAWSPEYVVLVSQVYSDLVKIVDAFSSNTVLKLFNLALIVPFLSLFLLISLLDLHMRLIWAVAGMVPIRFTWSFSGNYVVAMNEPAMFYEWTKVSGVYDRITYRDMLIRGFYEDRPLPSYTLGTFLSLIVYLRSYGVILFFCAILFPGLFVNYSRWHILAVALSLYAISLFGELLGHLLDFIKREQVVAGEFSNYIYKFNRDREILQVERPDRVQGEAKPKTLQGMEAFEAFLPCLRIEFVVPIWHVDYDLRSAWLKVKKQFQRPKKPVRY